jgi:hypothetical protein
METQTFRDTAKRSIFQLEMSEHPLSSDPAPRNGEQATSGSGRSQMFIARVALLVQHSFRSARRRRFFWVPCTITLPGERCEYFAHLKRLNYLLQIALLVFFGRLSMYFILRCNSENNS